MANGINDLLQNKLFLQYLSAASQDIGSGEAIGTNVNAVTQQSIKAQNYAKRQKAQMEMFQKMLGGEDSALGDLTPDQMKMVQRAFSGDNADKLTVDGSKLNFTSALGGTSLATEGAKLPGGSGTDWEKVGNPFDVSQLDTTASDLAGLTPQEMSGALSGAFNTVTGIEALKDKRVSDVVDRQYKQSLMDYYGALTEKAGRPAKDERTVAQKNYEFAQSELGGNYEGTFSEFQRDAKTTHQKDYKAAVTGGYGGTFHEWMFEMAQAGATQIGDIASRAEVTADVKSKKYFTDPKGLSATVTKRIGSEEFQNKIFALDPSQQARATIEEKATIIESEITSVGATIEDVRMEGRIRVWTVKWPDGKTSEVKYAF